MKKDIKGFVLGMPVAEFTAKLKARDWVADQSLQSRCTEQFISDDMGAGLTLEGRTGDFFKRVKAAHILVSDCGDEAMHIVIGPETKVAIGIFYRWRSQRTFNDVMASIAPQFGLQAKPQGPRGDAEWELAPGVTLRLAQGHQPYMYSIPIGLVPAHLWVS